MTNLSSRKKQMNILAILAFSILIVFIAIAYSSFNNNIDSDIENNDDKWDLYFEKIYGEVEGDATYSLPILNGTSLFDSTIIIKKPYDMVKYHFIITNNGTVPATLTNIIKTQLECSGSEYDSDFVCNNIDYRLSYDDGTIVKTNDVIPVGVSKGMNLYLQYSSAVPLDNNVIVKNINLSLIYNEK